MKTFVAVACLVTTAACAAPALAGTYPVTGRWTYEEPLAQGPAKNCRPERGMDFLGFHRRDTATSVPEYWNSEIVRADASTYRVRDEFFNFQIRGSVYYTLHLIDDDHIRMSYDASGKTFALRRCAAARPDANTPRAANPPRSQPMPTAPRATRGIE